VSGSCRGCATDAGCRRLSVFISVCGLRSGAGAKRRVSPSLQLARVLRGRCWHDLLPAASLLDEVLETQVVFFVARAKKVDTLQFLVVDALQSQI